jgi:hypothetical protein
MKKEEMTYHKAEINACNEEILAMLSNPELMVKNSARGSS